MNTERAMTVFNFLNLNRLYILSLFLLPSLTYTFFLYNNIDLPGLSVLSSEKFWIYLVEHKRGISEGLLAWPGNEVNLDNPIFYIERILVRLMLFQFDPKFYFVFDALISSIFFIFGISFLLKKYYQNKYSYLESYIILFLAIQPLYLLKTIYFDINVFELWWGRNLVSTLSMIFFFYGLHEMHLRKNILTSLAFAVLLGLTHFYSFILFLGSFGFYLSYLILSKNKIAFMFLLNLNKLFLSLFFIICIFAILINTYLMNGLPEISYFFERYTPPRNSELYKDLLFHELKYLIPMLTVSILSLLLLKDSAKIELEILKMLILVIFSAVTINLFFYITFPEAINIHFRIYIIEPLLLFIFALITFSNLKLNMKPLFSLMIIISLILPYNLSTFISTAFKEKEMVASSVHYYLYSQDISNCQCTIFDADSIELLTELKKNKNLNELEVQQWTNALIHKQLYFIK